MLPLCFLAVFTAIAGLGAVGLALGTAGAASPALIAAPAFCAGGGGRRIGNCAAACPFVGKLLPRLAASGSPRGESNMLPRCSLAVFAAIAGLGAVGLALGTAGAASPALIAAPAFGAT